MNVNKQKKQDLVKELKENFETHDTFYLLDFVNMPVFQSVAFRRQIREQNFRFKVIKNRLALRALTEDLPEELRDHFRGPTAVAFASEKPLQLARLIRDFGKQHRVLKFKAGLLEGQYLPADRFEEVSQLGSKETLLTSIGYLMAHPLIKLIQTWQAPIQSVGRLLSQLKSKK